MKILLIFSGILTLTYLLCYCHAPASWPKTWVKTLSVFGLALVAFLAGGPALLVVALLLSAIGDFLLSREGDASFLAGAGAFAAGHIAYIALFLSLPQSDVALLGTAPGLTFLAALALFGAGMMRGLWLKAGDLRIPVMAYVPIIMAMGVAAATLPGNGALAWVWPAALLFMASDSVLAADMFLLPKPHPLRRITPYIIWGFYWTAQAGFLLAFTN